MASTLTGTAHDVSNDTGRIALIATSNKIGVVEFGRRLVELGWAIVATRGTAALLRNGGVPVKDVEILTSEGELFGGRIKALDRGIFAGILFRRDHPEDCDTLQRSGHAAISMVVTSPYLLQTHGPSDAALIESVDVGGPAMLRAAAKNYAGVFPVTSPDDYPQILAALAEDRGYVTNNSLLLRKSLAAKAFYSLSLYDATIARCLEKAIPM